MKLRIRLGRLVFATGVALLLLVALAMALEAASGSHFGTAAAGPPAAAATGQGRASAGEQNAVPPANARTAPATGNTAREAEGKPAAAARTPSSGKAVTGEKSAAPPAEQVRPVAPAAAARRPPGASLPPDAAVRRAWERARDIGVYHFATNLTQNQYPAPRLANAGRGPEVNRAYLDGSIDAPHETLSMALRDEDSSQSEVRVEGGKAYGRAPGGTWQELPDFNTSFAPGNDPLGFLAGIKNVRASQDAGTRGDGRYAFDVDGPAFAAYARERLQEQLASQGKLPAGITIDTPAEYRGMTGSGEIWIDAAGLPARLAVHLVYPTGQDGSHAEADITTDFSGFALPEIVTVAAPAPWVNPFAWASATLDLEHHAKDWQGAGRWTAAILIALGLLVLLVIYRRARRTYVSVAVAVILATVLVSPLQSDRARAFAAEQAASRARQAKDVETRQAVRDVKAELNPAWDPHQDPLTSSPAPSGASDPTAGVAPALAKPTPPQPVRSGSTAGAPLAATTTTTAPDCDKTNTGDTDNDGVGDYEECLRGMNGTNKDMDDDDLLDGIELNQVGTSPMDADTDGDQITDTLEIRGYPYNGKTWYLNPNDADTDHDTLPDSTECPQLIDPAKLNPATVMADCDTDKDGIPDPFDTDSDNDGVPDKADVSATYWVDGTGLQNKGFASAQPFTKDNRFALSVNNLQDGWPVLVDLQLRPTTQSHLAYSLGALDWPSNGISGQIQHVNQTTFANSPTVGNPKDQAGAHGDMRMIPMLEIEMDGNLPLKLTMPAITATVGSSTDVSTTVRFAQDAKLTATTNITFTFGKAGTYSAQIFANACPGSGAPLWNATGITNGKHVPRVGTADDGWLNGIADGRHALVVSNGTTSACAEIPNIVNGPYANRMVDTDLLGGYGIAARDVNTSPSSPVLMYVPLNVASDDTGGGLAAFQAHMIYWPGAENPWDLPQQIRVVWAVQALQDSCDSSGFPDTLEAYQEDHPDADQEDYDAAFDSWCAAHRTADTLQVVQTYDESWYVTGLSVREDHGMNVAAAYVSPSVNYHTGEEDLWNLSWGLSQVFLGQRDCEDANGQGYDPENGICGPDGKRDLTVMKRGPGGADAGDRTIYELFDPGSPIAASLTFTDRWGIDANMLRVRYQHYDDQDGMAYVSSLLTPQILAQYKDHSTTPTVLFAREEYFRAANLNAGTWSATASTSGSLAVDANSTDHPQETLTGVNWAPFRYNPGKDPLTGQLIGWEGYPPDQYLDQMETYYSTYFAQKYPEKTPDDHQANQGRVKATLAAYLGGVAGYVNVGELCPNLECKKKPSDSAADLALGLRAVGKGPAIILDYMVTTYYAVQRATKIHEWQLTEDLDEDMVKDAAKFFKEIDNMASFKAGVLKINFGAAKFGIYAVAGLMALAALALGIVAALHGKDAIDIAADILLGLGAVCIALSIVRSVQKWIDAAIKAGVGLIQFVKNSVASFGQQLKASFSGAKLFGVVVGLVIYALAFLIQWGVMGWKIGSTAWNNAFASMIAGMLVYLLLYIGLSMIPVIGPIIQAFLALGQILWTLICKVADIDRTKALGKWICGGLVGALTTAVKALVFSDYILVDFKDKKRLEFGNLDFTLADQASGYTVGNHMYYTLPLTNHIKLISRPVDALWAQFWDFGRQGDPDRQLPKSNFKYEFTTNSEKKLHKGLKLNDPDGNGWNLWKVDGSKGYSQTYSAASPQPLSISLADEPGIGQPQTLYLAEGYAVPDQECILFGCFIRAERATNSFNFGKYIDITVLTASATQFMALTPKGGGYAQAWGQQGDVTLPTLYDADFDSVPGISDTHDNNWDFDGDGLTDGYELQIGTDPEHRDTDGDTIPDADELRAGTNPALKDTDGDGLDDRQELDGWQFTYGFDPSGNPLRTWVWPDPLAADGDGDGITDVREKVYGYNPGVPSALNVLALDSDLSEATAGGGRQRTDGFVAPGQTLYYTATVTDELLDRQAQGLLSAVASPAWDLTNVTPQTFVLRPQASQTMVGQVKAKTTGASKAYSLTQVAGALITDWSQGAHGARLWMPFDDPAAPLADHADNITAHDGLCLAVGGKTPSTACATSLAGHTGSGLSLSDGTYVHSTLQANQWAYGLSMWFKTSSAGELFAVESTSGNLNEVQATVDSNGRVCTYIRTSVVYPQACTPSGHSYADGAWHHLVHTYGTAIGVTNANQALYLDGALMASTAPAALLVATNNGISIGGSRLPGAGITGLVDDVRLFDHRLTQAEVLALANEPVFAMNFDDMTAWRDVSAFATTPTCVSNPTSPDQSNCPTHTSGGRSSAYATFNGDQWLSTQGPQLNLSGGQLTMAAWVYPGDRGDTNYDTSPQGILGYHGGEADGYPALQRVGKKVRFGLSTGSAWQTSYTSPEVLTENAWNHVVLTYDLGLDQFTLYVNGGQVDRQQANPPITAITSTKSLEIGRSGNLTTLSFDRYHAKTSGDGTCGAAFYGELCWATSVDGAAWSAWYSDSPVSCDSDHNVGKALAFRDTLGLNMWERDINDVCGTHPDDNDDHGQIGRFNVWHDPAYYSYNEPGTSIQFTNAYRNCGEGDLYLTLRNNAIPFYGSLDDVRIYNQVLDADTVLKLYLSEDLLLRVRLDEPPGSKTFVAGTPDGQTLSCSNCPTAGLPGRMDQAASFSSAAKTDLQADNGPANRLINNLTVSAWIKPNSLSGTHRVMGSAIAKTVNGWSFGTYGAGLFFENFGNPVYISNGATLQPGVWQHVAAVMDSLNAVTFYVNGVARGTPVPGTGAGIADTDDPLLIGASTIAGQGFDGLIDDVRIYRAALNAAQVQGIYNEAPLMHLRFEEAQGAARFADSARNGVYGTCASGTCPDAGEAVKGQIGLAAHFDGTGDTVTVPYDRALNPAVFTIGAWVKPEALKTSYQALIGDNGSGYPNGYELRLKPNSTVVDLATLICSFPLPCYLVSAISSNVPLQQNQWNHLMTTYDGTKLRMYVNGSLTSEKSFALGNTSANMAPLLIGSDGGSASTFAGDLDEVVLYRVALTPAQISDIYQYQVGWIEDRESQNITVDQDSPSADVLLAGSPTYLPKQDTIVPIGAADPTSGIASAQLCVNGGCGNPAPRCTDPGQSEAWCATYKPSGEGSFQLTAQARDLVGNTGTSAPAKEVRVDDSSPNVAFGFLDGQRLDASPDPTVPNRWRVNLSGTASDRPSSPLGSGVSSGGVSASVYNAGGGLAGDKGQAANLSGGSWALDYLLDEGRPDGCYSAAVQATDNVGRQAGLSAEQVGRHTAVVTRTVGINSHGPATAVDLQGPAGGGIGPGTATIAGVAAARPVDAEVTWTTGADGASAGLALWCNIPGSAATYMLYNASPGMLAANRTSAWRGQIGFGSQCHIRLTAPGNATSGVISGTVSACGAQVASWANNQATDRAVDFAAQSNLCASDICSGQRSDAGVGKVETAFTPLAPGATLYNPVPPSGEVLHLPFDDDADATTDGVVQDVAPVPHDATCTGASCPTAGQIGHENGAAAFDGVDDVLKLGAVGTFTVTTVSAWVRPTGATKTRETIVSFRENATCGFVLDLQNGSNGYPEFYIRYLTPSNTGSWQHIVDQHAISQDRWTHLVGVYDGNYMYLYRDGQQVFKSGLMSGKIYQGCGGQASVGARSDLAQHFFPGQIDDVRIFERALSAAEIQGLYLGSAPVLALPFDGSWAADGAVLADESGWERDATLNSGANDLVNKASPGQVGPHALALDGVDDYAAVPDDDAIDFDPSDDFAVAAWIKPASAQAWTSTPDNNVVEKWSGSGGYPYSIRYLNQTSGDPGKIYAARWDGQQGPSLRSTTRLDDGRFHHVAFVKSGSTLALYVDGALQRQMPDTTAYTTTNTSPLYIGRRGGTLQGYFTGSVDNVRIYPRGLATEEVQELYLAGWQAATATGAGETAQVTPWQASVPAGLEGAYRIALRGWDTAKHWAVADVSQTWRGEMDSLSPRVTLCRAAAAGGGYTYTALAQDFNLQEADFSSPCGSTISWRGYYQAPWYLTQADTQRLYQVAATCTLGAVAANEGATACDSFGNCTTAGVSAGSVCDSAAATAAVAAEERASTQAALLAAEEAAAAGKPRRPEIAFVPSKILTSTHLSRPRSIEVTGIVSGTSRVSAVAVAIGGTSGPATLSEPAAAWPFTRTWSYIWRLADGPLPDGIVTHAVATATVKGGQKAVAETDLTLDVVAPAPAPLTMTQDGKAVQPGATLREVPADLALAWQPAQDGSGIAGYRTRWTAASAETTTVRSTAFGPDAHGDAYTAGEAQRLTVELASEDRYGNQTWQSFGTVVVDGALTPDVIDLPSGGDLPYEGWMDSGCSLVGRDRRSARAANGPSRLAQQFYTTWDGQALRLAWTGANWATAGDLFVYLDTRDGGTRQLFTPYAVPLTGTEIILPRDLDADYLVWVQDPGQAQLLRWDGSAWISQGALGAAEYRFEAGRAGGQTDLYLPFDRLGLAPGAGLGLLALAAEEPAPGRGLQLWATAPVVNPVNSRKVSLWAGLAPESFAYSLWRAYHWQLTPGICSNGTSRDTDMQLSVSTDPGGLAISGLGGGLFWVAEPGLTVGAPAESPQYRLLLPHGQPVGDGQRIVYTLRYQNTGSHTAQGVHVDLTAYGQLRLLDSRLDLGDIPPGGAGEATFRAVADRSQSNRPLAAVRGLVYAAGESTALDWFWAAHRVDQGGPQAPVLELGSTVGAQPGWLAGTAADDTGVREVTVEVVGPSGTTQFTCTPRQPGDGRWSCAWPGLALPDGAQVTVRARATDVFGQIGPWGTARTVRVDARPPVVTANLLAALLSADRPASGRTIGLYGSALDGTGVRTVSLCLLDGATPEQRPCRTASLWSDGAWTYRTPDLGALDDVTRTLAIHATDAVGNPTPAALLLPLRVDNVAPQLAVRTVVTSVLLGRTARVLSGTARDGGAVADVSVRIQAPLGQPYRRDVLRSGDTWSFDFAGQAPGTYQLWIDALDQAGNRTSSGPYPVEVTCTDADVTSALQGVEPVPGTTVTLTLTALVSNAGPDVAPAGLPVYVDAGGAPGGVVTTTQALAPSQTQALSLPWAPPGSGSFDITLAAGDRVEGATPAALCVTPGPTVETIVVQEVPLYAGWNLIAPAAQPDNTRIEVVERPIHGTYAVIQGYHDGLRAYYPGNPGESTLTDMEQRYGYWVRETLPAPPPNPEDPSPDTVATLRTAGRLLPEDEPLPLAAGWNLAGYLPRNTLVVTQALAGIAGSYAAVLGFQGTALSYYPDLDAAGNYNTLRYLEPASGVWISATQAITLQYPLTVLTTTLPITGTPTFTETQAQANRLLAIRTAEQQAGVQPSDAWTNLYGRVYLPDGRPAPISTTVTVFAHGTACGATVVATEGRFGLAACYRDDPFTTAVDGARAGDAITFLVDGQPAAAAPLRFNGRSVPFAEPVEWTGHGDRWEVELGKPPVVDVAIAKTAAPLVAVPGAQVTFTLAYSNAGTMLAHVVAITDLLPLEIEGPASTPVGRITTSTSESGLALAWQLEDLAPGSGGVITVTGIVSPALTSQPRIVNTAVIAAAADAWPGNNTSEAALQVDLPPAIVAQPGETGAQYSDSPPEVTITATDVAGEPLALSTAWQGLGKDAVPGLPDGLALSAGDCSDDAGQRTCRWRLAGPLDLPAGAYTITARVKDPFGVERTAGLALTVAAEDAVVTLAASNPLTVTVPSGVTASPPFTLNVEARETSPDQGTSPAAGDLGKAALTVRLVPAGGEPATPVLPVNCDPTQVTGSGYDARAVRACHFDAVPAGKYAVQAAANGGYYAGTAEGMLDVAAMAPRPRLWLPLVRR